MSKNLEIPQREFNQLYCFIEKTLPSNENIVKLTEECTSATFFTSINQIKYIISIAIEHDFSLNNYPHLLIKRLDNTMCNIERTILFKKYAEDYNDIEQFKEIIKAI